MWRLLLIAAPCPPWRDAEQVVWDSLCITWVKSPSRPVQCAQTPPALGGLQLPPLWLLSLSLSLWARSSGSRCPLVRAKRRQTLLLPQTGPGSRAKQVGDGGAANEQKWYVVTQEGPVDKEPRVQPGSEKEDRRVWGASKHSPIISQRKANSSSSSSSYAHVCSLLGKRQNTNLTDYRKGAASQGRRDLKKQKLCVFIFFIFFLQRKSSFPDRKSAGRTSTWTVEPGGSFARRLPVSFWGLSSIFLSDCVMQEPAAAQLWVVQNCSAEKGQNCATAWNIFLLTRRRRRCGAESHCGASTVGMFIHREWKRKSRKINW